MTTRPLYIRAGVAGVEIAAVLMALMGIAPSASSAQAAKAKPDRWEYAELSEIQNGRLVLWKGPDGQRHHAASFKDLAKKLKIETKHDDAIGILNALADDGWELVNRVMNGEGNSWHDAWTLRRRSIREGSPTCRCGRSR